MNCRWQGLTCFILVATYQPTHNMIAHAMTGFPPTPRPTTLLYLGIGTSRAEHPRSTGRVSDTPFRMSSTETWYLLTCFTLQAGSSFLFSIYT